MKYSVKPLTSWPVGKPFGRKRSPFRTDRNAALSLLAYELSRIGAKTFEIEMDIPDWAINRDGSLHGGLKASQMGVRVVVRANTTKGLITLPSGTYTEQRANIYAVAMTLEKLRAVDRYDVTMEGQQYQGFTAIPASTSMTTKVEAAWQLLADILDEAKPTTRDRPLLDRFYRDSAKVAHPDAGGSEERMAAVNRARETILLDLGER